MITKIALLFRAFTRAGALRRNVELKNSFGNMDMLKQRFMIDALLRGLVRQPVEKADANFVDDVNTKHT